MQKPHPWHLVTLGRSCRQPRFYFSFASDEPWGGPVSAPGCQRSVASIRSCGSGSWRRSLSTTD